MDSDEDLSAFADAEGTYAGSGVMKHSALKRTNSGNVDADSLAKEAKALKDKIAAKFMSGLNDLKDSASKDGLDAKERAKKLRKEGLQKGEKLVKTLKEDLDLDENDQAKIDKVETDLKDARLVAREAAKNLREDEKARAIRDEAKSLIDDLKSSEEANDLLAAGSSLLASVKTSETGRVLLNAAGTLVEDRGDDLLKLSDQLVQGGKSALGDLTGAAGSVVDKDKANGLAADAESLARKVAQDERTKKGAKEALDTGVIAAAKAKELATIAANEKNKEWALKTAKKRLDWIKEEDIGRKALKETAEYAKWLEQKGGLDFVVSESKNVMLDPVKRQEFLTKVKDQALNFLLSYLPAVEVEKIEGSSAGVNYTLDNIDLSNFQVPADSVDLLIVDGAELHLQADDISFEMKDLQWTYQQDYFPYLSGAGTIDCVSERTQFKVVFRLDILETVQKKQEELDRQWYAQLNARKRIEQNMSEEDKGNLPPLPDITEYRKKMLDVLQSEKPSLVMDEPHVYLDHLDLTINGSRMSWLYNALGAIFNGVVRQQIEDEVVNSLLQKSRALLDPLNKMGETYWPTLLGAADSHLVAGTEAADGTKQYLKDMADSEEARRIRNVAGDVKSKVMDTDAVKQLRKAGKAVDAAGKSIAKTKTAKAVRDIRGDLKKMRPGVKRVRKADIGRFRSRSGSRDLEINIKSGKEVKRASEYSATFGEGPLGFGIGYENGIAVIKRLNKDDSGRPMQAETQGILTGDVLKVIGGKNVHGWSLGKIAKHIKKCPRPLKIVFSTLPIPGTS
eukprot:g616.t1